MSARLLVVGSLCVGSLLVLPCRALSEDRAAAADAELSAALTSNHAIAPDVRSPEFPYLLVDPLRSRPRVLDAGASLPGDAVPIACPASVDVLHPLTLIEVVDMTLCANPQVQAAWAAVKVGAAGVGEARSAWLPTANATVTQQTTRTDYPGVPLANTKSSGHTVYASLTWRLMDFGARSAGDEAAARTLQAALASHDAALQRALSGVVQAYFDALAARAGAQVRHDATRLAQLTFEATQRREQSGASPVGDTLQAKAALAKARLAEQRATGDYRKALSVLMYAAGLNPELPLQLAQEGEAANELTVADLQDWLTEAAASHPAILAAKAQLQSAEANVQAVRAQGMPSLDFTSNYYQNGYPNQGLQPTRSAATTIGLTLTIPLFDGFSRTYQVRRAQAEVEQGRAQLQDVSLQTLTTVVRDHADAVAALGNLASTSDWLTAATDAVASARRRYDKGAGDVLELLTAESALGDAQLERAKCVSEWRAARLKLSADAGRLGLSELARAAAR
jgi:outer membrane protein